MGADCAPVARMLVGCAEMACSLLGPPDAPDWPAARAPLLLAALTDADPSGAALELFCALADAARNDLDERAIRARRPCDAVGERHGSTFSCLCR